MSSRATDNLRHYIRNAHLPEMRMAHTAFSNPPDLLLSTQPSRCRNFMDVYTLNSFKFNKYVAVWSEKHIPNASLGVGDIDKLTGEYFSIPCLPQISVPLLPLLRPDNIDGLLMWMSHYPVETVRRALHILYPETDSWNFIPDNGGADRAIFRSLSWSQNAKDTGLTLRRSSINIYIQPPWVLSTADLEDFSTSQSVRPQLHVFSSEWPGINPVYPSQGQQQLWDKIWDMCISKDSPWFMISTYSHWVFGVFSAGWTTAFVSPVYSWDSQDPSILELLLFWFISSMGLPGGWQIPEIRLEPAYPRQLPAAAAYDIAAAGIPKAMALSAM
ncbi:hypothetical protein BJ138DRAFT_1076251 [Hygrophoropsis aurantiaca]|uniref:Uncharacterized protein n=1 Tax=Hygrophoropsis aurantiaca TaxID=72124 RepID=A0ACB8ARP6_9AGAM|nr:hypothetical protein BJ138DRAFT_1076251 [Hygrophoropsis aurantiaca]